MASNIDYECFEFVDGQIATPKIHELDHQMDVLICVRLPGIYPINASVVWTIWT